MSLAVHYTKGCLFSVNRSAKSEFSIDLVTEIHVASVGFGHSILYIRELDLFFRLVIKHANTYPPFQLREPPTPFIAPENAVR